MSDVRTQLKLLLTITLVTIMLLGCAGSKAQSVTSLLSNSQVSEAFEEYENIIKDDNFQEKQEFNKKLRPTIISKGEQLKKDFEEEKIDYIQAKNLLEELKKFDFVRFDIQGYITAITKLQESRTEYKKALEYIENKEYINAIISLNKVDKEDKNYTLAQEKISSYMDSYRDECIKRADEYQQIKDYDNAIKIIEEALEYAKNDPELTQKKAAYLQEQQAIKEEQKQKLLTSTTSAYDDMRDVTIIVPKGYSTRYVNINRTRNITPEIIVPNNGGVASLIITVGFEQDDWVFTDKIIFKADNEKFEWYLDSLKDRQTQVIWGGVAEWVRKINELDKDLVNQMEKLANANEAKIRFQGQGYRDHVLTQDEKENLKLFLELYYYYEN
jgi:tetratricopeptide (TPR) repeat protein